MAESTKATIEEAARAWLAADDARRAGTLASALDAHALASAARDAREALRALLKETDS